MTVDCKSTCSPMAIIFLATLLYHQPTAAVAQTELDAVTGLTSALLLGEESFLWLLLDRSSGSGTLRDSNLEAVSTLLTLFDLQEELLTTSTAAGEAASQDDESALTDMQTLLTKVINDSCNYINVTLHDVFTTDGVENCCDIYTNEPCDADQIHFMKQTFECTREAAKELQTKLELLLSIRASKDQIFSLQESEGVSVTPKYRAWIDRGNFNESDRKYLECVVNSYYI